MAFFTHGSVGVFILAGLSAGPAFADLTAQDVWESWKTSVEGTGQTVLVENESFSGGVLSLDGVAIEMDMPDGDMSMSLGSITLTEQGDGSVALTMPDSFQIAIDGVDPSGEPVEMEFDVEQTNSEILATGDPGNINYAFSSARTNISVDGIEAEGEQVDMDISVSMVDFLGSYDVTQGDTQNIESDFTAGQLTMDVSFSDPEASFNLTATLEDLASTSTGQISAFSSAGTNIASLLRAGLGSEGSTTIGKTSYSAEITSPETPIIVAGSAANSVLDFAMNAEGLRYGGSNTDVVTNIQVVNAPVPPIGINIARSSGEFWMPLISTEELAEFGLKMDLEDLTISEDIWAMIDPGAALPRDPANMTIDISGDGKWNFDISDPTAIEEFEAAGEMPGELSAININTLALSMLGAQLDGVGAFSFNNDGPIPVPSGEVDFELFGLEGLLTTLVSAGLLPQEQATGAQLMMGLFAKPGNEPDSLVSKIELKEDGSVLANGQRIR